MAIEWTGKKETYTVVSVTDGNPDWKRIVELSAGDGKSFKAISSAKLGFDHKAGDTIQCNLGKQEYNGATETWFRVDRPQANRSGGGGGGYRGGNQKTPMDTASIVTQVAMKCATELMIEHMRLKHAEHRALVESGKPSDWDAGIDSSSLCSIVGDLMEAASMYIPMVCKVMEKPNE